MHFYHYTDSAGLIGILEGKMWLSNLLFLNDTMEMKVAYDAFIELHDDYFGSSAGMGALITRQLLEPILNRGDRILPQIYVACFILKEGNKLSQWRGYCPIGGFSIGFDEKYMKERFTIEKCIYEKSKQKSIMEKDVLPILREAYDTYPETMTLGEYMKSAKEHSMIMDQLNDAIERTAPLLKHEKFYEEHEWRIIHVKNASDTVEFRPGKYYPIPYITSDISSCAIREIVIGPTPYLDAAERAVASLVRKHELTGIKIVHDMIPLRL